MANLRANKKSECGLCKATINVGDELGFFKKYSQKQGKEVNVPCCFDGAACAERQRRQEAARPNSPSTSTPPSPPSPSGGSAPSPSTTPTQKASTSESGSPSGESWRKRDYYHAEIRVRATNDTETPDEAEFMVHVTHEIMEENGNFSKIHYGQQLIDVNTGLIYFLRNLREQYTQRVMGQAPHVLKESKDGSH